MPPSDGPLAGRGLHAHGDPTTARLADQILAELGAEPGGQAIEVVPGNWAGSGAMALTGRCDGPALPVAGAPASTMTAALAVFGALAGLVPPSDRLLGERAALMGLHRQGPRSAGGAFRLLPSADGWVGVSLPRPSDIDLLPALVGAPVGDPWDAVRRWLSRTSADAAVERAVLLGLALSAVPGAPSAARRPAVRWMRGGPRLARHRRPRVLDLSSLWAGPLCGHLLTLSGADVVKIESVVRPDGARLGNPIFFDLLHAGQRSVALDLRGPHLGQLIAQADLVIEGSRPRALRQLGIVAEDVVAAGTSWVSITAYGRESPDDLRIGFGDDVAAGSGLLGWDDAGPSPAGDAIADPLTGAYAAAAAAATLTSGDAFLLDVSMHDVARLAASARDRIDGEVVPPAARRPVGRAPDLGRHTAEVLASWI